METLPSAAERQQLISFFLEVAADQTADVAARFLEATGWKFDEAVQLFYVSNESGGVESSFLPPQTNGITSVENMLASGSSVQGALEDEVRAPLPVLMDIRDKLLFEPEYAGDVKEKVPPKSFLRIPWCWLPGALCLLQEVGEEKLVLEIGQAALKLPNAKAYNHDLLFSMALAECSIAKVCFEKTKISEGFEALARAQYLLRSSISLHKIPLLSQIEESLEDLAPACTLELLSLPHSPESTERRHGALAALQELVRQGLDVEPSCRVQDWPCFLSQAMNKLIALEIVDLLSWDTLAVIRKNKKSIESQSQKVIIDFGCFYLAMMAHIALGFSTRNTEMITRAKNTCECLIASEGATDLKFEEAFCSFLLGQHGTMEAIEKLNQLLVIRSSTTHNSLSSMSVMEKNKDTGSLNQALENWLKDEVLCLFPDTRDCSPSLTNFFGRPKRILITGNQQIAKKALASTIQSVSSFDLLPEHGASCGQALHVSSTNHLGEAVKQLAPVNLQMQKAEGGTAGTASLRSQLKNLESDRKRFWESWFMKGDTAGMIAYMTLFGCILLGSFKLFALQFTHSRIPHTTKSYQPRIVSEAADIKYCKPGSIDLGITSQMWKFWVMLSENFQNKINFGSLQQSWPSQDVSSPVSASVAINKQEMPIKEAEALVKQWQYIKAEALGPEHQIQLLPSILSGTMLMKWQDLASSAKVRCCFWRFVLLQTSIVRAEILSDGIDSEIAEIEALLEEAAELIDGTEAKTPSYYSSYKVFYILRRHEDGSWKFCEGGVENQI
ncbi:plastid division protein CDP1, chloroplastic-like [Zingiber officinale]|uniref:plastid division protein CDP1, chloroplastic-like n=1 Tax=Zingiber officinale TaxID=94328 RepID=UPI001C4CE8CA|nr:plastid division protein CDP1, chloroplastic-like [Zingiber officinale]